MRPAALSLARAGLLAGPTVLAFFSGGYFTGPRLAAGAAAWALLAVAVVATERPRPHVLARLAAGAEPPGARPFARPAAAAFGGLALLAVWTAISAAWAPLGAPAADALDLALVYLGALGAAYAAFRTRAAARAVEPALAAGIVVVIGYGLAGRVLPGLVELNRTRSSGGRLDQPLTYWNATGALAALGLVLCARLAGDRTRPLALRVAGAAASAPLGLGLYLSFSRGALTALGVGLAVLLALAPTWPQLRAGAIALEAGAVCAGVASLLPAVESASGDGRQTQGAVLGVALLASMAGAAALQAWSARAEAAGATRTGLLPSRTTPLALAVAAALAVVPFAAAAVDPGNEQAGPAFGATAERFGSVGSRRFAYWEAALSGFADDPAVGRGAGGYQAIWSEKRDTTERVHDAHSLELETAAELGVVGLALLALFLGGIAAAARRTGRAAPGMAAGLALYGAHSAIDWDWELPALTLVAIVLAGTVLAAAERPAELGEQRPLAR